MKNIIILTDHNIGSKVVNLLQTQKTKYFKVLDIYTTKTNNEGFWRPIDHLFVRGKKIKTFRNDKSFIQDISKKKVDYMFLLSWKYKIPKKVISKVNYGIINLHYSLLPNYRGVYPVNNAIIHGEKESGVTFHWINYKIDLGHILHQKKLNIESYDTASSLIRKLDNLAFKEFKKIWLGKIKLSKKNKLAINSSLYYSKRDYLKHDQLDLKKKYYAVDLINLIRGKTFMNKSNLYYLDRNNKKINIVVKFLKQ